LSARADRRIVVDDEHAGTLFGHHVCTGSEDSFIMKRVSVARNRWENRNAPRGLRSSLSIAAAAPDDGAADYNRFPYTSSS
jgi:hypothetical protein